MSMLVGMMRYTVAELTLADAAQRCLTRLIPCRARLATEAR